VAGAKVVRVGVPRATVVGGLGYAGSRHVKVLSELGYEVSIVDVRPGAHPPERLPQLARVSDIIVFADTPRSRLEYLEALAAEGLLENRLVVLEKPPFRPQDLHRALKLLTGARIDWVPVHNYLWMPSVRKAMQEGRVEVVVLRPGPHKGWYTSVDHSGGGVLLDHGYHWLYVAHHLGDREVAKAWIDTFPETEACFKTLSVKAYLSWRSLFRATYVNGRPFEPRSEEMIESYRAFYTAVLKLPSVRERLREQALWVMTTIAKIYEESGLPWRGRGVAEDEPRG